MRNVRNVAAIVASVILGMIVGARMWLVISDRHEPRAIDPDPIVQRCATFCAEAPVRTVRFATMYSGASCDCDTPRR